MRRILTLILMVAAVAAASAQVRITTPNTELVLKADQGSELQIQYFGSRLSDA